MPYEDSPETVPTGEAEQPPEEMGLGNKILHGAAIFGNSATMGIVPALAGLNPDAKRGILKYLREGEEELGDTLSTGIKVAGAFATPIPGLGAIKGATALGKLGAAAAKGAIVGGVGAGVTNVAEQSPGGIDIGSALKSAGVGAVGGAALGSVFHGIGSTIKGADKLLRSRGEDAVFAAGGGSAGTIRALGNYSPLSNKASRLAKEESIADFAKNAKWVGNAGQGWQESIERSGKASDAAKQKIEEMMTKFGERKSGGVTAKAQPVIDHVEDKLISRFSSKTTPPNSQEKAAIDYVKAELQGQLGWDEATMRFANDRITPRDLQGIKTKIGHLVYSHSGEKAVGSGTTAQVLATAKAVLSDLESDLMKANSPAAGKMLDNAKKVMHYGELWRNMGIAAKEGQSGLIRHLMGDGMRSIPDTYVLGQIMNTVKAPKIVNNALVNQLLANQLGKGRIPNALLSYTKRPVPLAGKPGLMSPLSTNRMILGLGRGAGSL
jgi:hypothetical protein